MIRICQNLQKRLDNMLYVGLTEEHRESATMFADVVGSQVISQLRASSPSTKSTAGNKSGLCDNSELTLFSILCVECDI